MSHPRIAPDLMYYTGSLIGQCLGDALGAPVEGRSQQACQRYVNGAMTRWAVGDLPFACAQYTDDSQLARELIKSYCDVGDFDPADYARRIEAMFRERRIVGAGFTTWKAAHRLSQGKAWYEAGVPPPSAGNGSAMRAAPVGLMFYDRPQALLRAATDQSRITHKDPRCIAGSIVVAGAVAEILLCKVRGVPFSTELLLDHLVALAATQDLSVADALRRLHTWVSWASDEAVGAITSLAEAAGETEHEAGKGAGVPGFVTSSVLWALYSFLKYPTDYWQTICTAIGGGGDTDTTAAMAGAISGAHLGLQSIPDSLARSLTDKGTWGYDDLISLATQFWELTKQKAGLAPPSNVEE